MTVSNHTVDRVREDEKLSFLLLEQTWEGKESWNLVGQGSSPTLESSCALFRFSTISLMDEMVPFLDKL